MRLAQSNFNNDTKCMNGLIARSMSSTPQSPDEVTLEISRPGATFDLCLSQTRMTNLDGMGDGHSAWAPRIKGVKDVTAGRDVRLPRLTESK